MSFITPLTGGFSPPDINEDDIAEVVSALKSGWITTGPKTKEFERKIAEYCGTSRAVCLNSQTACAEMTLRLLGIGPGDEVIVPAYTYTATASVVAHVGAKLVMVDSQQDCVEMDYDKVAAAITEKTKVIIPVDLAGIICDYDKVFQIVESKKSLFQPQNDIQEAFGRIIVMADGAHSFGATQNGKRSGSIADFTNFSFHAVKNLTTAEGGAVTWRDIPSIGNEELYKQYQLLSLHGQSKDALHKNEPGSWEYDIVAPFYKCNMTDIHAALGLSQLRRYEKLLARRREIIERYDAAIKPMGMKVLNHYSENHSSSGHLYLMNLTGRSNDFRNNLIKAMAGFGVCCNVHYKPLPMLSAYKNLGFDIKNYPNAYKHFENEVTLPVYTRLEDNHIDYVISCIREIMHCEDVL